MTREIIRRPAQEDIDYLIANIRVEDAEEIKAMSGGDVGSALRETPDIEKNAFVWEKNGEVLAVFGINPIGHQCGVIWMLGTENLDRHLIAFTRGCRDVFEKMIEDYDYLFNYVYAKNERSIRWLTWLGFNIDNPELINDEYFCRFEMWNEKCVIQ